MKQLLDRAFGVRPHEADLVVSFFCFFTGVGMFYTVGCTVGDTLFLSSLPPARVPQLLPLVSGEAIRWAVPLIGTKNLLYVGAALLLGNAAIAFRILRIGKPVLQEAAQELNEPERAPLRAVFARPYVRYLALVIPLAIAL